ncbi:MAG: diguanylate cyclase, partial [Synergistaceae bacterium]|nr:diguanylate cyclase [Synergistaceae bacterium]
MFNQNDSMTLSKISANMPGTLLVYKADETHEIIFVSDDISKIFECDSVQDFLRFTGGSFANIVYPEDIEEVDKIIHDQINYSGGYDYITYRIITKNGRIKEVEDWGKFVHDDELGDLFYVYLHDMDLREKLLELSGQKAPEPKEYNTDELTGLYNMKYFRLKAPELVRMLIEKGRTPNCIYFNIRNFHTYNETYGFSGGDRMLRSVARILQDTFPQGIVARFEGDHFVVITAQQDLEEKIKRMTVRINNIRRGIVVEIKAGVYKIRDTELDISVICDCAKLACDSIKREYGTTVQFYDGKMEEKFHLQEHILSTFDYALNNGYIRVYFQPVVDIRTGKTSSLEALTRWEDSEYGTLSPANFLYVLEEQHLIHKLDSFMIKKVCEGLRERKDRGD